MEVTRKTTEYRSTIEGIEFHIVAEENDGQVVSVNASAQSSDPETAPPHIWVSKRADGYSINTGNDVPFATVSAVVAAVDGLFNQPSEEEE